MSKNQGSAADRVKANRIRKKPAEKRTADDVAYLTHYEAERPQAAAHAARQGRSMAASERHVVIHEKQEAAAEGDHSIGDTLAIMAEGVRPDTLMRIMTDRLLRVNQDYRNMAMMFMEQGKAIGDAQVQQIRAQATFLDAVRTHFLGRVEAEGEAQRLREAMERLESGGDEGETMQMVKALFDAFKQGQANSGIQAGIPPAKKSRKSTSSPTGKVGGS